MSVLAPLALAAVVAATPLELEYQGIRHVVRHFERAGRTPPEGDRSLALAARALAQESVKGDSADTLALSEALSDAEGWDPNPRALILRGDPPAEALRSLLLREDFGAEPATHVGMGAAFDGDQAALVLVLSQRKVDLNPFPRSLPAPGTSRQLCGQLRGSLQRTEVYVTLPSGKVEQPGVTPGGPRFCASLHFSLAGRYTVEIIGYGPSGPEVAGLFFVQAGGTRQVGRVSRPPEPTTVADARRAVVDRVNALREAHELRPLALDDFLTKIAQSYSEQMASQGFFSHVTPKGQTMRVRLRQAGYMYKMAGENLAIASGPLAAHFAIEQSPGHRKNLLEPGYTQIGIGVVFQKLPDRDQAVLTELYAAPDREVLVLVDASIQRDDPSLRTRAQEDPSAGDFPLADAYRALQARRSSNRLPPLERDDTLEVLARDLAEQAQELKELHLDLPNEALVFAQLHGLAGLTSKLLQVESPAELQGKDVTVGADRTRVGIGGIRETGGKRYWVAIIYGASR